MRCGEVCFSGASVASGEACCQVLFSCKALHFLEMDLGIYFPGDELASRYTDRPIKSPLMSLFCTLCVFGVWFLSRFLPSCPGKFRCRSFEGGLYENSRSEMASVGNMPPKTFSLFDRCLLTDTGGSLI